MNNFKNTTIAIVLTVVGILCFNIVSSKIFFRTDVTENSVFTLSEGTKRVLSKLPDEFTVKFYFSRSHAQVPPMIKNYATRVEEVLREYASYSDGSLQVEVYDPKPDTDEEEWARKYGITGARLPSGEELFLGAVFLNGDKEKAIPYFDARREEFLEYDLTEALVTMQETNKPKVGVLSSLPVMGGGNPMMGGSQPGWVAIEALKKNFEVEELSTSVIKISDDIGLMILIHPKELSDKTLYAIDQFVMRGGKLMVFVDPFSRIDLAASGAQARMRGQMPSASSDLKKLFTAWGVKYNSQEITGDLSKMMRVNAGGQLVSYPYFFTITEDGISSKSVVSGKLNELLVAEPGAFTLDEQSKLELEPVLRSTEDSGSANGMMAAYMNPADFARQLKESKSRKNIAGILKGRFSSAFTGLPKYEKDEEGPSAHLSESASDQVLFLMMDVDFMSDANAVDQMRFGGQVITRLRNDNLNLLLNTADHLGGNEDLINIRGSGKISRPFTKVQEIQKNAQKKWKEEEERLSAQLSELQKKLTSLQKERTDQNVFNLSADQQSEIKKFRAEERQIRKKRREVRRNLREDIEHLGFVLKLTNLLLVPFLVIVFGLVVFVSRQNKIVGGNS